MMCVLFPQCTQRLVLKQTLDTTNGQCYFALSDNCVCPLFWQVDWASRMNRMASLWFVLWDQAEQQNYCSEPRKLINWTKILDTFFSASFWPLKKKCRGCVFQLAEVCAKVWGLYWNLTTYGMVRALVWFKKCTTLHPALKVQLFGITYVLPTLYLFVYLFI